MERSGDYKEFLEREFQTRLRRNPGYSLRAFARDLGMQSSKISEVLRGRCGLSTNSAEKLAKHLKLSPEETLYFVSLVESRHARSKIARKQAQARLESLRASGEYDELNLEHFKIISDWHHFAILELTELSYYESAPTWIAGRLGISTSSAQEAIDRLLDFGLLKKNIDGKLTQTHLHLATPSGVPSRAIREHHSQILKKADEALEQVDISERDFSAVILTIDSNQMEKARREFKEFRRKFSVDYQREGGKDRVYCLATQFFPLDRISKRSGKGKEQ